MSSVIVEVIAVKGTCNAELKPHDVFLLKNFRITPQGHNKACGVACASLVANVGRLKIQPGPVYVSCPDPGTGVGGNVLFELSWAEDDEDDQH
jgi:uncharacterized repeat protein (TIGR04076 family)